MLEKQPAEAETAFRRAIELRSGFSDAYNNLGAVLKGEDRRQEAADCFRRAIEFQPDFPEAYNNLGLMQAQSSRLLEAEACFNRAIALRTDYPEAYNNLGLVQLKLKQPELAEASFRQAIELRPDYPEAYNNLGTVLREKNCLAEAETCLCRAAALRPDYPEAYYNLGFTQAKSGRIAAAEQSYGRAIALRPRYSEAYNNLGVLFRITGRAEKAEECFRKTIQINPDIAEGYNNLGAALKDQNRLTEAELQLRRAIELCPCYPEAYNNLGNVLKKKNDYAEAEDCFRQAIQFKADFPEAYNNLGMILTDEGQFDEAEECLSRAVELRPDFPEAEYAFSTLYLLQGRFDKGWGKYESRFAVFDNYQPAIRRWRGEDLTDRKILLFCEQGLGDTIQFIRYAPQVAAMAGETNVLVQKSLVRLLADQNQAFTVLDRDRLEPEEYDFACPLLSLPLVFGTTGETISGETPYIKPAGEISRKWRDMLQQKDGGEKFRVGVVWAGNPEHQNDGNRSIPFDSFAGLFDNRSVSWYSLQAGEKAADLAGASCQAVDLSPELTDFAETAGVIENLDLVVTVDTAAAHLAGAMGKETWLLLPFAPEWRWQLDREDSPWYPAMRLFRQQTRGDWQQVIGRVKEALEKKIKI